MGSRTEGAYPPEMMNCMHTDFQIEVEKWLLVDDLKILSGMPRAVFLEYKKMIILRVPSGVP